jgi:hypothetical protein
VHPHERGLGVEQSPESVEVSGVNRVGGGFEPGVHRVVPVGERFCPVRVPVILGDGEMRWVRIETTALYVAHDAREAENLDSRRVTAGNGITQQLSLEGNPVLHRNLGPIHHRGQEAQSRHPPDTTGDAIGTYPRPGGSRRHISQSSAGRSDKGVG